ncbi:MAG: DUF2804 domain-containing protein [Raoultibacter sp.]
MSEHQITRKGPLHNAEGTLAEPGWANTLLLTYDKALIKAPSWRVKEWDYYLINDDQYAVALTLGDLGYMGLLSASLIDFKAATFITTSEIVPLPLGKFNLPTTTEKGVSEFHNKRVSFRYEVAEGVRHIKVHFARFDGRESFDVEATLDEQPRDSMVIATPWAEDPLAFYYNQKILAMRVQGSFKKGKQLHGFSPDNSFGLLDWGRGVWTRDNHWFWACAQGWQEDVFPAEEQEASGEDGACGSEWHRVGLNLGYGFGDTSAASENMLFIDGEAYKFGVVAFDIPKTEAFDTAQKTADRYRLLEPWPIHDEEGLIDLVFTPLLDRIDYQNFGIILSDQHQVFGEFSGTVIIEGSPFIIDKLKGSAEVIHNKY